MDIEKCESPILVYGNHRGNAQPIRCLLYYLKAEFQQLHLDNFAQMAQGAPTELIGKYRIRKQNAPYLIHQGYCFSQIPAIMSYLCRRYSREDLLGYTIWERAKVNECMLLWAFENSQIFGLLIKLIEAVKENKNRIKQYREKLLNKISSNFEFTSIMAEFYNSTHSYVLRHITVLDFLFMDSCFYFENMFKDLQDKYPIIRPMLTFKSRFEKQQFYAINKAKLNSFPVMVKQFGKERILIFKQLWLGDISIVCPQE